MKNLIFAALLLASFSASAATQYFNSVNTQADIAYVWGGGAGCSKTEYRCYGFTRSYRGDYEDGELPAHEYQWASVDFIEPDKNVLATFSWDSTNISEGNLVAYILMGSGRLEFTELSGSYTFLMSGNATYFFGISGYDPIHSSIVSWELTGTPVNEVPLPASIALFLPVLLGFTWFRRRYCN